MIDGARGKGFDVIPAIDLRGGRVVRLQQGDFGRETVYGDDPSRWRSGSPTPAPRSLHVVDLDGARAGEPTPARRRSQTIAAAVGTRAIGRGRPAGSARSRDVDAAFAGRRRPGRPRHGRAPGPGRSFATPSPATARSGSPSPLDVRDGLAVGHGWVRAPPAAPAADVIRGAGRRRRPTVRGHRDRPRRPPRRPGPRASWRRSIALGRRPTSSPRAGSRTIADLKAVRDLGCAGAIVGRALYDGRSTSSEAIADLASA